MTFNIINIFNIIPDIMDGIYILITILLSILLAKLFMYLINFVGNKFDLDITLIDLFKDFLKYLIYIFGAIIVLEIFGIDITTIMVSFGIVGVTIGFAAKDIISNVMSGVFLILDKTVKVAEFVEVDNVKGKVKKLGFRNTTLITPDNKIITVPNSVLSTKPYISYTYLEEHRIDLNVLLPLDINIKSFKKDFINDIAMLKWVLHESKPQLIVSEIIDTGINVQLSAWCDDFFKIEEYRLDMANEASKLLNKYSKI
jgi:small conductance mechanosensitive channel